MAPSGPFPQFVLADNLNYLATVVFFVSDSGTELGPGIAVVGIGKKARVPPRAILFKKARAT